MTPVYTIRQLGDGNKKVMKKIFQLTNLPIQRAEGYILQQEMLENFFQIIMYPAKGVK